MSSLSSQKALQQWCKHHPDEAAAWRLAVRSGRAGSVRQETWSPPQDANGEASSQDCVVACLVGAGMAQAAISWCQRSSDHRALLVLVHAEDLDALSQKELFCDVVDQRGLTLSFRPLPSLASQWTCPAFIAGAALHDRLVWGADAASQTVLPQVQAVIRRVLMVLAECGPSARQRLSHFWHNLSLLPQARNYSALKDAASGSSIIVAGGGPSLTKVLKWLKHQRSRCLLFAGGAALQCCAREGVAPDIAFLCDPTETQWDHGRILRNRAIPLVTTLRCHAPTLASVRGPLLFAPRADEVLTSDLAEHLLGLQGSSLDGDILDVGGLMIAFAIYIGAQRILLAGRELCWSQTPYAHEFRQVADPAIQLTHGDQPIWTTPHWLAVAEATRLMVSRHPRIDWHHCGSPSLPIPGVGYQEVSVWGRHCKGDRQIKAFRLALEQLPNNDVGVQDVAILKQELVAGLQDSTLNRPGAQLTNRILGAMETLFRRVTQASESDTEMWRSALTDSLKEAWMR